MMPRPAPYAGVVTRGVALVIDVLIVDAIALVVSAVLGLVLSTLIPGEQSLDLPTVLASAAAWTIFVGGYFAGFWALVGHTPGMRLLGLELVTATGERVRLARACARVAGMVLAAIPFGAGFLLSLVDDRRQGLQDKVAGTVVLYVSARAVAAGPVVPLAGARLDAAPAHGSQHAAEPVEGTVLPPGARPA
jgi:uncharacterized RDD family membrane protein YckC